MNAAASTIPSTAALDHAAQRSFRDALGRFTTGVALVTATSPTGPVGLAVNSFASVSLAPPMVSFCPMVTSESWAGIREVGSFAVSLLGSAHEPVSRRFASRGVDKFDGFDWQESDGGHPVLAGALAWLDVRVAQVHRAGDHDLVLGDVLGWKAGEEAQPLVFFGGRYAALAG